MRLPRLLQLRLWRESFAAVTAAASVLPVLLLVGTTREIGYWNPVDGTTVATATGGAAPTCVVPEVSTTVAIAGVAPLAAAGSTATAVATKLFCGYATGTSACSTGFKDEAHTRARAHTHPQGVKLTCCDVTSIVFATDDERATRMR